MIYHDTTITEVTTFEGGAIVAFEFESRDYRAVARSTDYGVEIAVFVGVDGRFPKSHDATGNVDVTDVDAIASIAVGTEPVATISVADMDTYGVRA